ncbi:MAG: hypothetical protein Q7Q73_10130 [Verrucomicrobiota bacterium JB024]|nr:hypothetical protein [Verrucomicrobiota bacterium JB024]
MPINPTPSFYQFNDEEEFLDITTPVPPAPWVHDLYSAIHRSSLDQELQGVSYQRRSETFQPLTRSYRYFFVSDEETGEYWSLNHAPTQTPFERYNCRFTPCTIEQSGSYQGLTHSLTVFVPRDSSGEHTRLSLMSEHDTPRKLSLFYVVGLAYHADRGTNAGFEPVANLLYHVTPASVHDFAAEHGSPRKRYDICFLAADQSTASWEASEWAFFGGTGAHSTPIAVQRGRCSSKPARAVPICAAMHWRIELEPGKPFALNLLLDTATSLKEAVKSAKAKLQPDDLRTCQARLAQAWRDNAEHIHLKTPDENLNRFFNTWIKRQMLFMTETDRGENFVTARNRLQDLLGFCLIDPGQSWERYKEILGHQNASGHLSRGWDISGSSREASLNRLDFRDGSFWVIFVGVILYQWQNSSDCLDEHSPFTDSNESATVYEHLKRSFLHLMSSRGEHGLILLGQGDWNDALNGPGAGGKGESVMLTASLIVAAKRLQPIACQRSDVAFAESIKEAVASLAESINTHAWNGHWYSRGFDDNGVPFGTPHDSEGKIWLNAQTWPILAGIVPKDHLAALFKTIEAELETDAGLALLAPAFSNPDSRLGSITTRLEGGRVNGSVYNHAVMFAVVAALKSGHADQARRWLTKLLPTNPDNPPERNGQAPTYIPNYYVGPVADGTAGTSSRMIHTGSAAWFMWCLGEVLPGLSIEGDRIHVTTSPQTIPWDDFELSRRIRGSTYHFHFVKIPSTKEPQIQLNGEALPDRWVPVQPSGNHQVLVTLIVNP